MIIRGNYAMETRKKFYGGMGTALEEQSKITGKWYHVKWVEGPIFIFQKMLDGMKK